MRNIIFMLVVMTTVLSCDKLDELTMFEIEYQQRANIPSSTGVDLPFDIITPETETNSDTEFESNETRKDLIEEIKLIKLELVLDTPADADFSFLKSIEIFISADGLDEISIASVKEVPEDIGNILVLDTSNADLKKYIKKDKYSLRLNTVTDELITRDHELEINSTFFVDAKILGL